MLVGGSVAGQAAGAVGKAAAVHIAMSLLNRSFNPKYKKSDRKRMRHIQQKYSLAYEGGLSGEDPCAIIKSIDPNSKILMSDDGVRPANPFPDERAFEDSLLMNFHPVSGHQGRFVASHAMTCIGMIIDYQIQRRKRIWAPGVSSPGRPNDYINLFLEETKVWLRHQMTLDTVHAEELVRRDNYYTKLKNDDYYWCFPKESESKSIHRVIDFVHDKVKNALEIMQREEKNKSLQGFFKELNDHTTNVFEFGKFFLAYIMYSKKKVEGNLLNHRLFNGKKFESGKLHRLLEKATKMVFESYSDDMKLTYDRIHDSNTSLEHHQQLQAHYTTEQRMLENVTNNNLITNGGSEEVNATGHTGSGWVNLQADYMIEINDYVDATFASGIQYLVEIMDAQGHQWIIRKTYLDFEELHEAIREDVSDTNLCELILPNKLGKLALTSANKKSDKILTMCVQLQAYFTNILSVLANCKPETQTLLCKFMEIKQLQLSTTGKVLRRAEAVPNYFVALNQQFKELLIQKEDKYSNNNDDMSAIMSELDNNKDNRVRNNSNFQSNFFGLFSRNKKNDNDSKVDNNDNISEAEEEEETPTDGKTIGGEDMEKALIDLRAVWGIEMVIKIFEAYALLQRLATMLGWTLEINHFFLSMFGNTLAFSKLPLRDIIFTLKDIMTNFLLICNELYTFACKVHSDSKYKWHKNLQMAENELKRIKYHVDKAVTLIGLIDSEHLDYEMQVRRLRDVHARFQPLMNRIDGNLSMIQEELHLPVRGLKTHHQHNNQLPNQNDERNNPNFIPRPLLGSQREERQVAMAQTALVPCGSPQVIDGTSYYREAGQEQNQRPQNSAAIGERGPHFLQSKQVEELDDEFSQSSRDSLDEAVAEPKPSVGRKATNASIDSSPMHQNPISSQYSSNKIRTISNKIATQQQIRGPDDSVACVIS